MDAAKFGRERMKQRDPYHYSVTHCLEIAGIFRAKIEERLLLRFEIKSGFFESLTDETQR